MAKKTMTETLQDFLAQYLGQGTEKKDIVTQEAIDELVEVAEIDGIEQDIIDYGTENPDAPFWDFLNFIKPGLKGDLTEEDMLADD